MNRKALAAAALTVAALSLTACDTDTGSSSGPDKAGASSTQVEMTKSQENAVEAAESYLDFMAFSHDGLIKQLSSKAGDGYPVKDAAFAVDHLDVDWDEQAVKAAKSYLDTMPFSHDELVHQLTFDGFTAEQAAYGVKKAGL